MSEKQTTTRRAYTPAERAAAVTLANRKGVCAAARELGIPQTNVSKWAKAHALREGLPGVGEPKTEPVADGREPVETPATTPATPPPAEPSPAKRGVARAWTPSQKASILEHAATHGVTPTAKKFRVSRFSIYEWQRRVKLAAEGKGPSPTSGPSPSDIEAQRDKEILAEWHHQPRAEPDRQPAPAQGREGVDAYGDPRDGGGGMAPAEGASRPAR
jgi:transposase-like protein